MHRCAARLQRSWASRGIVPSLLWPLAGCYALAVRVRRILYRTGWLRSARLPVRVIVVGNLIVGGAGKTPTVLALVAMLQRAGYTPAIVSRGYGGTSRGPLEVEPATDARACGDEPLLLRRRAGVPVWVGAHRVAAARALLQRHRDVDVIVSDDGLQHLRLGRDLQIVVFDERGVGNGWTLPAGPLREPLPRREREPSLVLYNAVHETTPWRGAVAERRLAGVVDLDGWWRGRAAEHGALERLRGRKLVAAAGLARPERFFAMLRDVGLDIEPLALPDHFDFATLPWPHDAADVVVTEKDAVKIEAARVGATRVWVAALDFVLPPAFDAEVLRLLGGPTRSVTPPAHGNPPA